MARKATPSDATPSGAGMPAVERVSLDSLIHDPENARTRDGAARAALESSVREFGPARSAVMDGDGIIRAGNGTLEAAKAAGVKTAIVVEADGTELVVVRRKDMTGAKALAYGLADNRTSELASWDERQLAETIAKIAGDPVIEALRPMSLDLLVDPAGMTPPAGGPPGEQAHEEVEQDERPPQEPKVAMTFQVTPAQHVRITEALAIAGVAVAHGQRVTQGDRLAAVCEAWLAGGPSDERAT